MPVPSGTVGFFVSINYFRKKTENNIMSIKGNIEGLRKGKIFLQKIDSGLIINVDSIEIKGDSKFLLNTEIDSPEIFYLYLKKECEMDVCLLCFIRCFSLFLPQVYTSIISSFISFANVFTQQCRKGTQP